MTRKSFKERSPKHPLPTIVLIAISLGVVTTAERDIQRRPDDRVRGNKWLWRLISLNALGAAAYFRWGRLTPA
ncbi:MAG: hypothetical protein ACRDK7_04200 [Solirubrobacteraceae bacterium]